MNIIIAAARFAANAHEGQQRKYNGQPYIYHPARVASRVAIHPAATQEMIAAAFLHDVMEDCGVTYEDLKARFGESVADMVKAMTNPSKDLDLPRSVRKQMDRDHLTTVSPQVKIIKLIDRIDNVREVFGAPTSFVRKYAVESELLAHAIGDADADLKAELLDIIDDVRRKVLK